MDHLTPENSKTRDYTKSIEEGMNDALDIAGNGVCAGESGNFGTDNHDFSPDALEPMARHRDCFDNGLRRVDGKPSDYGSLLGSR